MDQILSLNEFNAYLARTIKTNAQLYANLEDVKTYEENDSFDLKKNAKRFNNEMDALR